MKRDIRDLFKGDEYESKSLPDGHREEFFSKLKASQPHKQRRTNYGDVIKVAASLLLFFAVTFVVIKTVGEAPSELAEGSAIERQVQDLEKKYLASINEEWNSFISLTKDDQLIDRYERKLEELDQRYKAITVKFKNDPNDIIVLEELVDNLKTRLQLLKDIQTHIKLINQTNEQHENSI